MHTIPYLPLRQCNARYEPALSEAVLRAAQSGRYLLGEETAAFEQEFAALCRAQHCVAVSNGLDALTLALLALRQEGGWRDGDEVVVPALTFIATAEAVVRAGLTPVFADVDAHFTLSPEAAEAALSPRTRALLPVHLYGHCADLPALERLATRHGLVVLHDAAQAHGHPFPAATAAFSFYPGKNLGALGDAGALVTPSAELAQRIRTLANYGAARKYHHTHLGLNARIDEVQAAALRVKLPFLPAETARRRALAHIYSEGIHNSAVTIPYGGDTHESVFHIYPLLCPHRDALQQHLQARGIETLIHYPLALHQQEAFTSQRASMRLSGQCPVAERVAAQELSLPLHPALTDEQAQYIVEQVNRFSI